MTGTGAYYLLMLGVFLLLMLGLGVWVARRSGGGGEDFLLAGRGLRAPLLLGTTLATLVGTGSSLGAVGFAYTSGWAGLLYGIGGAAGVFGLLLLFADVRDHGFWTFPEEMSFYYGANAALKNVVAVVLFVAEIGWLGAHMLGGSIYLEYLTGIDPTLSKAIVAVGFGLYVIVGGYLADVITDAVQGAILFVGFSVLAVLSFREAGGFRGFSENLPDGANSFLGMGEVGVVPGVSLAAVIAVGVLATPSYRQRIYSATSTATVRRSFLLVGILFALFAVMPAIAGMSARVLNGGIQNSDQAFPFLATEVFPLWLGGFLLISGLSATASSGDSDAVTAVTIFLRDVYRMVVGRLPAEENMVLYSRIGIAVVMSVAFVVTIFATSVIDYITLMISTVLTGLFVASVLGKFWPRATWQGGIACMAGGSATALAINASTSWTEFWGNPVLPSLLAALLAGVAVSLLTPRRDAVAEEEEALRAPGEERSPVEADPRAGARGGE